MPILNIDNELKCLRDLDHHGNQCIDVPSAIRLFGFQVIYILWTPMIYHLAINTNHCVYRVAPSKECGSEVPFSSQMKQQTTQSQHLNSWKHSLVTSNSIHPQHKRPHIIAFQRPQLDSQGVASPPLCNFRRKGRPLHRALSEESQIGPFYCNSQMEKQRCFTCKCIKSEVF